MPLDPTIFHRQQVQEEEKLRDQYPEGSPLWFTHNENMRFHEAEIRQIERMKKLGVKF